MRRLGRFLALAVDQFGFDNHGVVALSRMLTALVARKFDSSLDAETVFALKGGCSSQQSAPSENGHPNGQTPQKAQTKPGIRSNLCEFT